MDMKIILLHRGEIVFRRRNDNHNNIVDGHSVELDFWEEILEETLVSLFEYARWSHRQRHAIPLMILLL